MFKHGVYIHEDPTPILPPVRVNSAIPVAFVTAPIHLAQDPYNVTNKPELLFNFAEGVRTFGHSMRPEIWDNYTSCQMLFSQFTLFGVAPLVVVNVLDPTRHIERVQAHEVNLVNGQGVIADEGVLIDTVKVAGAEDADPSIVFSFNRDGHVVIHATLAPADSTITVSYTKLAPEKVDIYDIIGGYNSIKGKNEGLEAVEDVFPLYRVIPGQLLAPGFSSDPVVAAVMETKGSNINGHFRCITLCDMPASLRLQDVPRFKNLNNFVSTRQINCWPKLRLGNQTYYFSTQLAGLIGRTDHNNRGVPYHSPSNLNLRINGICDDKGEEIDINKQTANHLNSQGIVTAINSFRGWVAWGNHTGIFPGSTDVKDKFIPIRRMFDWIGNTIVKTYWQKVDFPMTPRTIDTIIDSVNIWLNGLAAQGFILGGRAEFLRDDNPTTDLLSGIARFRVHVSPPPPLQTAEFILQYDPEYLQTLFA